MELTSYNDSELVFNVNIIKFGETSEVISIAEDLARFQLQKTLGQGLPTYKPKHSNDNRNTANKTYSLLNKNNVCPFGNIREHSYENLLLCMFCKKICKYQTTDFQE